MSGAVAPIIMRSYVHIGQAVVGGRGDVSMSLARGEAHAPLGPIVRSLTYALRCARIYGLGRQASERRAAHDWRRASGRAGQLS